VTRGQLPQRAGSLGRNGGGTAVAVPPKYSKQLSLMHCSLISHNLCKCKHPPLLCFLLNQSSWRCQLAYHFQSEISASETSCLHCMSTMQL